MSEFIDKNKKPYPYCPGCSHNMILDAIDRALERAGADPKRTVLVSDIGCVGIADKYFSTHTFHGLHGRSFTYAAGIKIANPDLNVFVVVGDGGCGIGGHHLINSARRNVGITVICFDNFNFGMTGGEHSVTTPIDGKTNTTLNGNIERPFDLCSLVMSAGATFVARKTALDKDLDDVLAQAIKHEGFSFVDVLELCTAYYSPMNAFKKKDMDEYIARNNLGMGILCDERRSEFGRLLHSKAGEGKKISAKGVELKFSAEFEGDSYDILLAGSAGMKIISAAASLAQAGLLSGLWASEKDDYPVTVQTGHSTSVIKFSRGRVNYLGTSKPDAAVVISEDGLKKTRGVLEELSKDDIVIICRTLGDIKTSARVVKIDLDNPSNCLNKTNKIIAAIASLLKAEKSISPDAFRMAIESISNEKIRNENIKAFDVGIGFLP